jgi:putative pyruvate formate lyase activating enzyme
MPPILKAVRAAMQRGLNIPLVYNTGGYELTENISLLDGIVDIYLPDLKFMDGGHASLYAAGARDYPDMARRAVIEMHRQVGDLVTNPAGIALRGLMVRHLVMPNRVAGTREFLRWAADNLSPSIYINIMSQYRPEHRAFEHPRIARAVTAGEVREAAAAAREAGLRNIEY